MDIKQYKKEWFDKFKGMYVYRIKDLKGKIFYVGQTNNYYKRLANHKSKCVKTTKEFISKGNYIIEYLDVSTEVKTGQELKYLENVLIDLLKPVLNDEKNIIKDLDEFRMFQLCSMLHNFGANWKTDCRYVSGKKDKKIHLSNHPTMIA